MDRRLLTLCITASGDARGLDRCRRSAARLAEEVLVGEPGLERATGRFVLLLEAGEWIESNPHPLALGALLRETGHEAFTVEISERLEGGGVRRYPRARLFRNDSGLRESLIGSPGSAAPEPLAVALPSGLRIGRDLAPAQRGDRPEESPGDLAALGKNLGKRSQEGEGEQVHLQFHRLTETVLMKNGRALPGRRLIGALDRMEALAPLADLLLPSEAAHLAALHAAALLAFGRAGEALVVLETRGDGSVPSELLRADTDLAASASDPSAASRALTRLLSCFDRGTRNAIGVSEPALAGSVARARAAEALSHLGRHDEARVLANLAAKLPGGGAAAKIALAVVERNDGRAGRALDACLEAVQIDPSDPWAWRHLGETAAALKKHAEAEKALRKALEIANGWTPAEELLAELTPHAVV